MINKYSREIKDLNDLHRVQLKEARALRQAYKDRLLARSIHDFDQASVCGDMISFLQASLEKGRKKISAKSKDLEPDIWEKTLPIRRRATREDLEEPPEEESDGQPLTLKWWFASQNNPMGVDDYFPEKGVGRYVLFQAYSKDNADRRFQDSVRSTSSCECSCCGPRWDWELDGSGTPEPSIDGQPIREYLGDTYSVGRSSFLHYWDGSIVEIMSKRENK
jgi:hypothetical protein